MTRSGSTPTTPSTTPVMSIFWNNSAALRKRRRSAKPPYVCLAPKSAQAWYSYGAFLEKHERMEEAIAQYRQALQVDPRFVDAHIDLAGALFAKGELEEAKAHYLEATRLDPKLATSLITIWERFLCARATLPRQLRNLNRRCAF